MIPLVKPYIPPREALLPALEAVLYSGYIAEGEQVYEFERRFGEFTGNKNVLALSSGTAALHIALLLSGVGPGDKVISTPLTAEPTNIAIAQTGAQVVWADVEPDTGLPCPRSVRSLTDERTKAIMLVHYAGMVCDMDAFHALSKETGIPIIEDAAHALGAKYTGGDVSPYTIYSFQAIKHMTTVDGGALALDPGTDTQAARRLRWFGLDKKVPRLENDIERPGYKYNMNNCTAAIGLCQLDFIPAVLDRHIANGKYYDKALRNIPGLTLLRYHKNTEPSYWLYTMKVDNREDFIRAMESRGVAASPLHLRNDRHSLFAKSKRPLPALDKFYQKFVHIPCGRWIDDTTRETIVTAIKQGW